MDIITLNTEDYRCPEVMIKVRRFLSTNLNEQNACEIITQEPSAMRDIPYYCQYNGYHVLNKEGLDDGTFRFLVSKTNQETDRANAVVQVVNVDADKAARDQHLYDTYEAIVSELYMLLENGILLTIPASFGKDSKLVLTAALDAHERAMANGIIAQDHPFIVIHIDTGIESIPMLMYSLFAMMRLEKYCASKGINLDLNHQQPDLQFQFASLFLGARKLPSTPSLNSDCAVIMKVDVSQGIQKKLIKKYGKDKLVSCIGSRHAEGVNRSQSLKKFGNNKQTALSLINNSDNGINTFAPISELSNEEVFELLQRMGTDPMVKPAPGLSMSAFMPSYRLLIQIYGDSANDTCEINVGDNGQKTACGGSARNGCLNCFKAGKVDKSVVSHNRYPRWATIQENANKVRDYMYAIAHDVTCRTHHPRAFDPVTGHAMLQPNILSSRVLERLVTYFVQLTEDDRQRAQGFRTLMEEGRLAEDAGYQDILEDASFFDAKTRDEFLTMYKYGASKQLIKTATLEHCIFLSAQWAMDGVKSLPFRPLAIYDSVVRKGRRIPYPNVDTQEAPNDEIGDAMAIRVCESGVKLMDLHQAPFRRWDVNESDVTENCSTVSLPNTLRVSVTYSQIEGKEILRAVHDGVTVSLGDNTKAQLLSKARARYQSSEQQGVLTFSQFLTFREMRTIGEKPKDKQTTKKPIMQFTKRGIKKTANGFKKMKTSLRMYSPKPVSSLHEANLKEVRVWAPNMELKSVPYIAQHQEDLNEASVNFSVNDDLTDWISYGGYAKALALHDEYLVRARRQPRLIDGKQSLRRFETTEAFWTLMQDGVISVNQNTWHTAQQTLQRTEIFLEAGLFNLPDDPNALLGMEGVIDMAAHRSIKAGALLTIREQRNEDRKYIKRLLNNDKDATKASLIQRMEAFNDLRTKVINGDYIAMKLLVAGGVKGFDKTNFTSYTQLADDWIQEHGEAFNGIENMLKVIAAKKEIEMVEGNLSVKLELNNKLQSLNEAHNILIADELNQWALVNDALDKVKANNNDGIYNDSLLVLVKEVLPNFSNINVVIAGEFLAQHLSYNKQSMMDLGGKTTLPDAWHNPHIESFKQAYNALAEMWNKRRSATIKATVSTRARNNAMMNFF